MTVKSKKSQLGQTLLHILFVLMSLSYLIPFLLVISISFTDESVINSMGYGLIPKVFSTGAYQLAFKNMDQMIDSYRTTITFSVVATALSVFFTALYAYPLSRPEFKLRKFFTFFAFVTMLFSGGLVPSYIINTRILHLNNTIWIYILPGLVSAWNIIITRTFFQGLPDALPEAARIDGASDLRIFFQIVLPLSLPVLAATGFLTLVGKWNDWNTSLIYITDQSLYSLQYMLQRILREAQYLKEQIKEGNALFENMVAPAESLKYAMAIIASGPMLVVFPFFQKYFVRGLTIGSVKG